MKLLKKAISYITILIILSGIGCDKKKTCNITADKKQEIVTKSYNSFPFIKVPTLINTNDGKITYYAEHFWDNINFMDSTIYKKEDIIKYGFCKYISVISKCNKDIYSRSIDSLVSKASIYENNYRIIRNITEETLYNPNSVLRNDIIYESFLLSFISNKDIDKYIKERYIKQLSIVRMNQQGKTANDFSYKDDKGNIRHMFNLKSDFIVLYFYNPGCSGCKKVTYELTNSKIINSLIEKKKVSLLAIFPDNDISEWKKTLTSLSSSWIKGYDYKHIIEDKPLYDLKAIPTLYLLNRAKKVIFKDASTSEIENYLSSTISFVD